MGDEAMNNLNKRLCDRKMFDESFSFELSVIEARVKDVKHDCIGVDISSCGLGMKTKSSLQKGSVLKFYLPMSEWEVTIPVYAQVRWAKSVNDHFRVGLRFLD
jgi:hypothetical protein